MRKTVYTCNLCNKIFDRKGNYEYHINRKNPCVIQPTLTRIDIIENEKKEMEERLKIQDQKIIELQEQMKHLLSIKK